MKITSVLRITGETPVPESLFYSLTKKETLAQLFPVNFAKFLRTPISQSTSENTSGRPLLGFISDHQCRSSVHASTLYNI